MVSGWNMGEYKLKKIIGEINCKVSIKETVYCSIQHNTATLIYFINFEYIYFLFNL